MNKLKIAILLPYKENFSPEYAGAVSISVYETTKISKFKKNIKIYGNTKYKKIFNLSYINLKISNSFFSSKSNTYIKDFINHEVKEKSDIIEIHNRPAYVKNISEKLNAKIIFYFHNDPLLMKGSKSINERVYLINTCEKIIFNSNWSKNQFIVNLNKRLKKSDKLYVIKQSAAKRKIDINKKKNTIIFVGKLNKAKGYDVFGKMILLILENYKNWNGLVVGDESREKHLFSHPRLKILGFLNHDKVLDLYKSSSIAIVCSRWEEPFGRSSLEASSNGCAVIITNKGGLPETIKDGIIINKLNVKNLYNEVEKLILDKNKRNKLQQKSIKNFYLTHSYISKKIDNYRDEFIDKKINYSHNKINKENLKILHITNFNHRYDGRLFYNTGKRINNGLIKLNHSVLELSDRDIVHENKKIIDYDGSKTLNNKIINICKNFVPKLIIFGHADKISNETIINIKKKYPNIKLAQWFLDPLNIKGPDFIKNKNRFLEKFYLMDANFVTTSPDQLSFLKEKDNCYFMPNPTDEAIDSLNVFNNVCQKDVFFAMSHGVHRGVLKTGKADTRIKFLDKLVNLDNKIKYDFYGYNNVQPIWADNFLDTIAKSKMGLNLSRGESIKYYSSDRIAQFMGNGLVTLINEKTQYNDFFTNQEMVFYKNQSDLIEKILQIKSDEKLRKKIGKNGKLKYKKLFNSIIVAKYIINKSLNLDKKKKFIWEA